MSTFKCEVLRVSIEKHPDPEVNAIELVRVGDYRSIARIGQFKDGDLAAYVPEGSIVPQDLLASMGLEGKLAGSEKNRVKAIKLRGVLSQGLVLPARIGWHVGQDVAAELGVTKWEPPIPTHLAGEVGSGDTKFHFDVENFKRYPDVLQEGEEVVFTEKIHGTCTIVGLLPKWQRQGEMLEGGRVFVSSKGLASKGLFLKDNERNKDNLYVRMAKTFTDKLVSFFGDEIVDPVWVLGESFGKGVQDLQYGQKDHAFRCFGIRIGDKWLDHDSLRATCMMLGLETVPVLYRGPFSKAVLEQHTNGKSTFTDAHTREGVVVTANPNRSHADLGRVILKSVSEAYLLRKGEATEFQ